MYANEAMRTPCERVPSRQPRVPSRYLTPAAATNRIVPSQSLWATQSGTPMVSNSQYQGPIGHR